MLAIVSCWLESSWASDALSGLELRSEGDLLGCPGRAELVREVRLLALPSPEAMPRSSSSVRVVVDIESGLRPTATILVQGQMSGQQRIQSPSSSCHDLLAPLAVALALILDSEREVSPREAASRDAAPRGTASGDAAPGDAAPRAAEEPPTRFRWDAEASLVITSLVQPITAGGALGIRGFWPKSRLHFGSSLIFVPPRAQSFSSGEVEVWLLGALLEVCRDWQIGTSALAVCPAALLAGLQGRGRGYPTNETSAFRAYGAFGGEAMWEQRLYGRLGARLSAGALWGPHREGFGITHVGLAYETPPWSAWVRAGFTFQIN